MHVLGAKPQPSAADSVNPFYEKAKGQGHACDAVAALHMDVSLTYARVWVIVGPCGAPVHHWCGKWAIGDAAGCSQAMQMCAVHLGECRVPARFCKPELPSRARR